MNVSRETFTLSGVEGPCAQGVKQIDKDHKECQRQCAKSNQKNLDQAALMVNGILRRGLFLASEFFLVIEGGSVGDIDRCAGLDGVIVHGFQAVLAENLGLCGLLSTLQAIQVHSPPFTYPTLYYKILPS